MIDSKQFEMQVQVLLEKYQQLRKSNAELKKKVAELEKDKAACQARIMTLQTDYQRLKMARMFGWSEESKREASDRLLKLIREIDRCLSLLND